MGISNTEDARLNEYDIDEWYDVCRRIKPGLEREEYEQMWYAFQDAKAQRALDQLRMG